MENLLLDSKYILKTLDSLAGHEKLQSLKIETASDIDKLKEIIIADRNFLDEELKIRLNEELSVFVNIDSLSNFTYQKIKERIDSIVDTKSKKIESILEKQTNELTQHIENKSYTFLNGKIILNNIAQKFGLEKSVLARSIAKEMKNDSFVPSELETIINQIK